MLIWVVPAERGTGHSGRPEKKDLHRRDPTFDLSSSSSSSSIAVVEISGFVGGILLTLP